MILTGKCLKCWERNLFQCHVTHQKSHTDWSGIEPRARRCLPIIGQFLLVCCYFRPLKPKCFSLHTLLKNLQPKFFPLCKGPSQTHKTTSKIIFLYILTFIFLVTNGKIKYWGQNTSRPPLNVFTLNLFNIPVSFLAKWSVNCNFSNRKLHKTSERPPRLHFTFYNNTLTKVVYVSLTVRCSVNVTGRVCSSNLGLGMKKMRR
jgi:hypothetical protein